MSRKKGAAGFWIARSMMTLIASGAFALSVMVAPAAASFPTFGFENFEQRPLNGDGSPDTQAGSHPDEFIANFTLSNFEEKYPAGGEVKDLEISLPAGFVGNPNATSKCPRRLFDRGRHGAELIPECPANTQVGEVAAAFDEPTGVITVDFPVYNLVPPPGVPAQFGFAFQFRVGFIDFGVRTGEGYALKVVLRNLDQLKLLRSSLTLWSVPAEHGTGALPGPPC